MTRTCLIIGMMALLATLGGCSELKQKVLIAEYLASGLSEQEFDERMLNQYDSVLLGVEHKNGQKVKTYVVEVHHIYGVWMDKDRANVTAYIEDGEVVLVEPDKYTMVNNDAHPIFLD